MILVVFLLCQMQVFRCHKFDIFVTLVTNYYAPINVNAPFLCQSPYHVAPYSAVVGHYDT